MASARSECQALQLSDGLKCKNEATSANGLFCWLHAKQVSGLYKGYKRRNAKLDAFDDEAPAYLRKTSVPLANQTFDDLSDTDKLKEVHDHLFKKYALLGNVIDARKLHHKHFYSLTCDYGHQAYLDTLASQRHTVLRALESIGKRMTVVLHHNAQWLGWAQEVQEEEEAGREKEQKKLKQEAAMFKRHWKTLQVRLARARQREEQKRQDAYLDQAYRERMAISEGDSDDDEAWDPIQDMDDDKRQDYIELIRHFLWMEMLEADEDATASAEKPANTQSATSTKDAQPPSKKGKKKAKPKGNTPAATSAGAGGQTKQTNTKQTGQKRLLTIQESNPADSDDENYEPDKSSIETEEEIRKRLSEGVKKNYNDVQGFQIVGTIDTPHGTHEKTAPMTEEEVDSSVRDIRQIKLFLFCRVVLAKASLLPAALRASSVPEFLKDPEITDSDLRDLCLKLEQPTLQDIRDACADFARGDRKEEDAADELIDDDTDDEENDYLQLLNDDARYKHLHTSHWLRDKFHRKEERRQRRQKGGNQKKVKRTKVTICGKSIWDHASESAMSRDGWLQFSIMAKDCDLKHAIKLCRNWAEFSELNLLTLWQYFPASNWLSWGTSKQVQQLHELEFFPYFHDFEAQQYSRHNQVGGRSQGRRQHDFIETRNVLVGHMKRNDPVTRRFLQYLSMRTGELLLLVRDGKTGRVITAPPEEHLWTYRRKAGLGRASKNEWINMLEVGPAYFRLTDKLREWHFGFEDYYDIVVWDFLPCQTAIPLYNAVVEELRNAWRIKHPRDVYAHMEPLLRTLTREEKTMRTRQVKPGEKVETIWDTVMKETNQYKLFEVKGRNVTSRDHSEVATSPYMFYNAASEAEDRVLFPDELTSNKKSVPFREIRNGANLVESGQYPSAVRHLVKGMEALEMGEDPITAMGSAIENDEGGVWALPKVWETALKQLHREKPSREQLQLLKRVGLDKIPGTQYLIDRLDLTDPLEVMERDRSVGFKQTFHAGDLEPGSTENYDQVQDKIEIMLRTENYGSADWLYFLANILDWMGLRADSIDYEQNPMAPWPHSFITQDLMHAFAAMAMFFPELDITASVTMFLNSSQCHSFKNSLLFNPRERAKTLPERRSRTSFEFRNESFWKEWREILTGDDYFVSNFPMDWSIAIRPIVAHLYRAGIIQPAYYENDPYQVPGIAMANREAHRPTKLDLFIDYVDASGNFTATYPANFVEPSKWPKLLPLASGFAAKHPNARFALLRCWSAPHFYPQMMSLPIRRYGAFLDSAGRSWEWKFLPKDMPGSELSVNNLTLKRLEWLKDQFGDRVVSRGDLILVMGENATDLLRYCTAVTFVVQTKPWLREIDLWKSFINVDLMMLEGLNPYWLD